MPTMDRYPVTQKYLMTRGQAINFPAEFFKNMNLKKNDVFGVVIDIPMPQNVLTTMVCFINGAANLYFNNGGEYSGASQRYRNLVMATNTMVQYTNQLLPKCQKVTAFDLPRGFSHNIFLLTKGGVYMTQAHPGVIPEDQPELRTTYLLYQKVLNELRSCQLKDEADMRKAAK